MSCQEKDTKSVGGQIPTDLFWRFKQTHVERHETATEALMHAIQLYIDAVPSKNNEDEVK